MIRSLCWFSSSLSVAFFLASYLLPEGILFPAGILCGVGLLLLSLLLRGKNRRRAVIAAVGLVLGLLWYNCYGLLFKAPAHTFISDKPVSYTMEVSEFPTETSYGSSLTVRLLQNGKSGPKVKLYADRDALALRPGDVISVSAKLSPSDQIRGDTVDYFDSKGIYLLGYAQGEVILEKRPVSPSVRYWPQVVSNTLKNVILTLFPNDVSGYTVALLTGDKDFLPTGLYTAFQRAGISHIVAVSGLHLTFLTGVFITLFGKRNRLAALASIMLVFFYAAVAGNSPSALRAAIMTGILFLAPLTNREEDKPTTLSMALALLLTFCPYAARSISLQLSFAAVAGIYLISGNLSSKWLEAIPKWKSRPGRLAHNILSFLCNTTAVTLGALLFTTPLSAIHFNSVSLVGPLINLLTLWAVSVSFIGSLLSACIGLWLPSVGIALAWLTAWPSRWAIWIAQSISRCPYASITLLSGYLAGWFAVAYIILCIWLICRKSIRPLIPAVALILTLAAALMVRTWSAAAGTLTIAALDVGQGASTLLYSKGHAVLVDCGGSGLDDAGDVAANYLQSMGLSHLDALILTHYHSDHANGVPELLIRVDVGLLVLPDMTGDSALRQEILDLAGKYECEVELLYNYDAEITFGDAQIKIYIPMGDGGANEEGLSVLCTAGDYDVLLTGDMNDVVERRLLKYRDLPDIELLMVGHHGSSTSTSEELLLAVKPEQAIISVGRNNPYGHPTDQTLERLGAAGCEIYRTDWMGTITITVGENP